MSYFLTLWVKESSHSDTNSHEKYLPYRRMRHRTDRLARNRHTSPSLDFIFEEGVLHTDKSITSREIRFPPPPEISG